MSIPWLGGQACAVRVAVQFASSFSLTNVAHHARRGSANRGLAGSDLPILLNTLEPLVDGHRFVIPSVRLAVRLSKPDGSPPLFRPLEHDPDFALPMSIAGRAISMVADDQVLLQSNAVTCLEPALVLSDRVFRDQDVLVLRHRFMSERQRPPTL